MTNYQKEKEAARQKAKEWQENANGESRSYEDLASASERFERLGKRYGLTEEFRENGII